MRLAAFAAIGIADIIGGNPKAVVDAKGAAPRQTRTDCIVLEAWRRNKLHQGRRQINMTACRRFGNGLFMNSFAIYHQRNGITLIHCRINIQVQTICVIANDHKYAVRIPFLSFCYKLRQHFISIPEMAQFFHHFRILLSLLRQDRLHGRPIIAFRIQIHRIRGMIGYIQDHMKARLVILDTPQDSLVKISVVAAPDIAAFTG